MFDESIIDFVILYITKANSYLSTEIMEGDSRIKRFSEFMNGQRLRRSLDLTIISGNIKGGFFSKGKPFEICLYHTTEKHRIFEFKIAGATLKDLKIDIKVGDSVDIFRNWAASNGYKIEDAIR